MSAVRDCLFNIFAVTLHIGGRSSIRNLRTRHAVETGTHVNEERSDDSEDKFCEELEQVFYHFPKYHMKILLRDFNAKLGREDILKPTIGNVRLRQDNNDNDVRIVNLAT